MLSAESWLKFSVDQTEVFKVLKWVQELRPHNNRLSAAESDLVLQSEKVRLG
jgi:hypothetical protein